MTPRASGVKVYDGGVQFHVITLFPDFVRALERYSVLGRGMGEGRIHLTAHDLRAYGLGRYRQVDDTPFGGGAGMVLRPEPLVACIEDLRGQGLDFPVVALTAGGGMLTQRKAERFAKGEGLILVCGHYEGIDQRVLDGWVDAELSIGKYVLSGGELAAMVVVDAVGRLVPGVLGADASLEEESFGPALGRKREYPHYTRPAEFRGKKVPDVLLSGNHKEIARWRREQLR